MSPRDLALVRAAHAEALSLLPIEREELLRARFPDDLELREEVRALIDCYEQSGEFLNTPLAERIAGLVPDLGTVRIGAYELMEELGRGGSAAVYRARRADDLFERKVAIKILNRLSHSGQVFLRFQREIQSLSRVEHPYIVRLLEAGTTGEALAYLVTELVEGQHLDLYAASLPLREKLQLFGKVCEGVSAAHRNLVVHRDLKPSNILVTREGTPKIVDFGIAIDLEEGSRLTETGWECMTVLYASPEQLRGDKAITTASDVYSLGVLLYELISGALPYQVPQPEPAGPPPLKSAPRELDAIVRKAMQKDPARRYESVERLRDDIGRYLDGSPVSAHGGDAIYRLSKFVRKHWPAVTAATAVILLLTTLLSLSIASSREARRQSARVEELLSKVLDDVTFDPGRYRTLRLRRVVEATRLHYLESLIQEYPNDLRLAERCFQSWRTLGDQEGLPSDLNLGETKQARQSLARAVQLGEALLAKIGEHGVLRTELANAYLELGSVLLEMGKQEEAQARFARAETLGQIVPSSKGQRVYLEALAQKSRILNLQGRRDEALALRRQIVSGRRVLFQKEGDSFRWEFAGGLCSYGELLREMGRFEESRSAYAEALPLIEDMARRAPLILGSLWHLARENEEYATVLIALHQDALAAKQLDRAVALYRSIASQDSDALSNQRALAVCLSVRAAEWEKQGQRQKARAALQEALSLSAQAAQHDPGSARAQQELANIRRQSDTRL